MLHPLGIQIAKSDRVNSAVVEARKFTQLMEIVNSSELSDPAKVKFCKILPQSYSQLNQDVLALIINGMTQNNYFVEFGAAGGKVGSNTFLLESKYSWRGIVAEPARSYKPELEETRKCDIDFRCVYSHSGLFLEFLECKTSMLSTISGYEKSDTLADDRKVKSAYSVETVSLLDLLDQYKAPGTIGYISIDTEGSEFTILENFDFGRYTFNFMSIEHNSPEQDHRLEQLLEPLGYIRILRDLSQFDSWYVSKELNLGSILSNWTEDNE
jgi:FkbM family methyltransferase